MKSSYIEQRNKQEFQILVSNIRDFGMEVKEKDRNHLKNLRTLTNRQTFKNIPHSSNPVWPNHLEAALVEGLIRFHTLDMEKNTIRKVKKNPYRNTFIADHILATTNEIRTRKQVASRLQHIRRYSQNETIRELIEWKKVSESQIQNIPSVLFPHTMVEEVPSDWHIPLSINIMSYSVDSGSPLPRILLQSPSQSICFRSLLGWPYGYSSFMRGMDPTIMLLSPIALNLYSTFELFENEILSLSSSTYLIPDGVDRNRLKIYILSFPDDLWKDLYRCHSFDQKSTKWSILQSIFRQQHKNNGTIQTFYIQYNFENFNRAVNDDKHVTTLSDKDSTWSTSHSTTQSVLYQETSSLKSNTDLYSIATIYHNVPVAHKTVQDYQSNKPLHSITDRRVVNLEEYKHQSIEQNFTSSDYRQDSIVTDEYQGTNISQHESPSIDYLYSYSNKDYITDENNTATMSTDQNSFRHKTYNYSYNGEFMGDYPTHDC